MLCEGELLCWAVQGPMSELVVFLEQAEKIILYNDSECQKGKKVLNIPIE